jgi:hypothetical protein
MFNSTFNFRVVRKSRAKIVIYKRRLLCCWTRIGTVETMKDAERVIAKTLATANV